MIISVRLRNRCCNLTLANKPPAHCNGFFKDQKYELKSIIEDKIEGNRELNEERVFTFFNCSI